MAPQPTKISVGHQWIIVDLESVLTNDFHRREILLRHLKRGEEIPSADDWENYAQAADDDLGRSFGVILTQALSPRFNIAIMTGREERWRQLTEEWLITHDVSWCELHMRSIHRPSESLPSLKAEWLKEFFSDRFVMATIDGHRSTLEMFRAHGVVALQYFDNEEPRLAPIDEPPPTRCIHCGGISDDYRIIRKIDSPTLVEYSCSNDHKWLTLLKAEEVSHGSKEEGGKEEGSSQEGSSQEEGSGKGSAQEHRGGKDEDEQSQRPRTGGYPP